MNNKLSLKNINVKYGESLALKSINLDIYKGEFVVLLGSSGAGKSTLLRTINQLNPLTSGELHAGPGRANQANSQLPLLHGLLDTRLECDPRRI